MNQLPAGVMIIVSEARAAADMHEELSDKINAAMGVAKNHWMVLDETQQFQGAVGGIMLSVDEETRSRIEIEMKSLNAMSAIMIGIPVDIESVEIPEDPIGLLGIWKAMNE